MRRAVITGFGAISPLGNDAATIREALRAGRSGISFSEELAARGLQSRVWGNYEIDLAAELDRKDYRTMSPSAALANVAADRAVRDADLDAYELKSVRTGLILGSGAPNAREIRHAYQTHEEKGIRKLSPFMLTKIMSNNIVASAATRLGIQGVSYAMHSACATSTHTLGHAAELVRHGVQDIVLAGGAEAVEWELVAMFDAMRALSTAFNDGTASRPYDRNRDGFVVSGGAGVVVIEEYERAKARGARILGEITGYAATSDGFDLTRPSGEGAAACMAVVKKQLGGIGRQVGYVNTHGTSTPAGDVVELKAIAEVFRDCPPLSSTKSLTGHGIAAAGVLEAIYCLLMLQDQFLAPSAHIEEIDPEAAGFPIVREPTPLRFDTAISNGFGFGGSNGVLALSLVE